MEINRNLKKFRKNKNLSQEELAEKVGVSRQSVSKWECNKTYPKTKNILTLCEILDCEPNELLNEKNF